MPELERDNELELAYGVRLRSSGVSATVGDVRQASTATRPVRGVLSDELLADSGAAVATLLPVVEAAGMRTVLAVPLDDVQVPPAASGGVRAVTGEETYVELSVPAPDPEEGQVVLEVDDAGLVRWHVDVDAAATAVAIADDTTAPPARGVARCAPEPSRRSASRSCSSTASATGSGAYSASASARCCT